MGPITRGRWGTVVDPPENFLARRPPGGPRSRPRFNPLAKQKKQGWWAPKYVAANGLLSLVGLLLLFGAFGGPIFVCFCLLVLNLDD